jgi:hypothetical protein
MMMTIQKHTQTDTHKYTTTVDLHRNFQAEYPEHTRTQRGTNKAKGNKIRHQILQNKRRNSPLEEARSRGSIKWREIGARKSQKIGRSADLSVSLSLSLSLSESALQQRSSVFFFCSYGAPFFVFLAVSRNRVARGNSRVLRHVARLKSFLHTYLPVKFFYLHSISYFLFLPFRVSNMLYLPRLQFFTYTLFFYFCPFLLTMLVLPTLQFFLPTIFFFLFFFGPFRIVTCYFTHSSIFLPTLFFVVSFWPFIVVTCYFYPSY